MTTSRTRTKTPAPAADDVQFSDTAVQVDTAADEPTTEVLEDPAAEPDAAESVITVEVDEPGIYPVDDNGLPVTTELHPLDAVDFLLEFVEHLASEPFDRARQRFILARNTERKAVSA